MAGVGEQSGWGRRAEWLGGWSTAAEVDGNIATVCAIAQLGLSSLRPPQFMQSQGNTKSNSYYEAMLGKGIHAETKRPLANTSK